MKKFLLLIFISGLGSCHFNQNSQYLSKISTLPAFDMELMDSVTLLHARNIPEGKPFIMVYFRPDCPHCQLETKNLVKSIGQLKDIRIYFLTSAEFGETKRYVHAFHLDQYPGIITTGRDHDHNFAKLFHPSSIPFVAIYDGQKKLIKIYHGEVPVDNLLASIHS